MSEIALKCRCGTVRGFASNVTADTGTRVVCHCEDCQAFARYLGRDGDVLDEYGGTDIFQMTQSQIEIVDGADQIRCMRLSSKGMHRWYAECCKTPIGNTFSAGMPFIGMIHNFMDDGGKRDTNLGPVRGYRKLESARGTLTTERRQAGFPLRILIRVISKMLIWKVKGMDQPSVFFDASGNPASEPHILTSHNHD